MSLTLYDLQEEERRLEQLVERMLESSFGEITDEVEEYISDSLRVKELLSDKLDSYYKVLKNLGNYAEGLEKERDSFSARADQARKSIDFLEGRIKSYMEANDIKSIKTPRTEFKVNGPYGQPPLILDGNPPDEFVRYEVTLKFEGDIDQHIIIKILNLAESLEDEVDVKVKKSPLKTKLRKYAQNNATQSLVRFGKGTTKLAY